MTARRATRLAWALGGTGTVLCCASAGVVVWLHAVNSFLLIYVVAILMGVLGALVAMREPRNSIGWLMCAWSLTSGLLIHLPSGYAYFALVVQHGNWPLGSFAMWLGMWSWVSSLIILPSMSIRFPDGSARRRARAVDWVTVAGVALFALGIILAPAKMATSFMPIPQPEIDQMQRYFVNPPGGVLPRGFVAQLQGVGLVFLLVSYVGSAAAVAFRFRHAEGDVRLQLKWFVYAGAIVSAAFAYGAVAWNLFGQPLYLALTPLVIAAIALPLAIAVAILRYRLYDIDLLINRTLVYAGLTAILGALYAAVVTFLNRLFISLSGQKSDAAYVITAFVVAVAFGPVKDWLQRQVDRRIGKRNAPQMLDEFRSNVEAVVSVIDVDRVGRQLLDHAVAAFNARGAALYLSFHSRADPVYSRGELNGGLAIEVGLRHQGRDVGRLVMGSRRGDASYSNEDRLALQRSADSVAEAIALAEHLGHVRVPVAR
jgi:hypothetical protein